MFLLTKAKGIGFGDVKFAFFMGLFLGIKGVVIALYISFIVGAMVEVLLIIFRGYGRKSALPFGPFLILGTFCAWWYQGYIEELVGQWLFW